jgi:hypothetical protein
LSHLEDYIAKFTASSSLSQKMGGTEHQNGNGAAKVDYYASGSNELATDTPLTLNRLETVSTLLL